MQEMRQEIICSATMRFHPDIFLVDHMPHGTMGELLPTLKALKAAGSKTKVVLGLHEIFWTRRRSSKSAGMSKAPMLPSRILDLVLIYGIRRDL